MEQTLGARITFHRKRLGMTQDKLAEQLGVTAQAVSKWENDQSCPDIAMIPKLADLFNITTDELLGRPQPETVHQAEIVDEEDDDEAGKKFEFTWEPGKLQAVAFAIWVLLVGALSVASAVAQWDVGLWSIAWPSFLLVFGIYGLIKHFNFFSSGCVLFGAYSLVANLGIWQLDISKKLIFPIILVLFGLFLLADALRKSKHPCIKMFHRKHDKNSGQKTSCEYTEDGETVSCSLSFGGTTRRIALSRLSSADFDCSFGDLTIDLTGCEQIADRCHIDADCSFGELTLLVPSQYRVMPDSDTSFGRFKISGQPNDNPEGTILLNADVSFGSILVQYI